MLQEAEVDMETTRGDHYADMVTGAITRLR